MKKTTEKIHMAVCIEGLLDFYKGRSMKGVLVHDDGTPCSDAEVRKELQDHLDAGHSAIPMCDPSECPEFDYVEGRCPGHGVHYYDADDNEISKAEYEAALAARKGGAQ